MSLSPALIEEIWKLARIADSDDCANWRIDKYGSPMRRSEHGNKESPFGWVIRRVRKKVGSLDVATNFQAILWKNVS